MNDKVKPSRSTGGRKAHAAASRQQIIDAAVSLFARHGYAGTGLRELAASAGVNLAMINYFFGSKKGLLKVILDEFFAGYLEIARRELQQGEEPSDKLERFVHAAVAYFAERRDYLVVVITELPHDDPEVIEHKASWGRQMMALLGKEICAPLSAERDRPLTPLFLGPTLTSMMAARFLFAPISERMSDSRAQASVEDYAAELNRLLQRGLFASSD